MGIKRIEKVLVRYELMCDACNWPMNFVSWTFGDYAVHECSKCRKREFTSFKYPHEGFETVKEKTTQAPVVSYEPVRQSGPAYKSPETYHVECEYGDGQTKQGAE